MATRPLQHPASTGIPAEAGLLGKDDISEHLTDLANAAQEACSRADYLIESIEDATDDALEDMRLTSDTQRRAFDRLIVFARMAREEVIKARDIAGRIETGKYEVASCPPGRS